MRFDEVAVTWDEDPVRVERARMLAGALLPLIKSKGLKRGLDFGAGTGLVSFHLAGELESITLVDLSAGMTARARDKIAAGSHQNMHALQADLAAAPLPEPVDILFTLLTLHHIRDTRHILEVFYQHLRPGGYCCIADLDAEDGSFHAEFPDFDGHNGFDQRVLKTQMETAGFSAVHSHHFYTIEKEANGRKKSYPLFLMVGRKPASDTQR